MSDDQHNYDIPNSWADIPREKQQAILDMADGNLFWKSVFKRFGAVGKISQIILAILAVWILFKDSAAVFLQGFYTK